MTKDIVGFYMGSVRNQEGYSLDEIMNFDGNQLEQCHSYIQWLFPLDEPSFAVPSSPILNKHQIEEIRDNTDIQDKVIEALNLMIKFYRFGESGTKHWTSPRNHNYLRLTRMIKSLKLLGLQEHANSLYEKLCEEYEGNRYKIGEITKEYWDEAIGSED